MRCIDAVAYQTLLHSTHLILAVGKDHDPLKIELSDQVVQHLVFVFAADGIYFLRNVLGGGAFRLDFHDRWIYRPLLRQIHYVIAEGGGEQQGLAFAFARRLPDDLTDLRDKAHVEHTVGFIENQHFDQIQMYLAAITEVEQTPRCRHQNIAVAFFQLLELFVIVHTANKGHDVQRAVLGQAFSVVGDLHDQFAGRRNDQRSRLAHEALVRGRRFQQLGNGRKQEGSGFTCSRLCPTDGVMTFQGVAQHGSLNGCAVTEALILDRAHDRVG